MKKLIAILLVLVATTALAQHSFHAWSLDGEYEDNLGRKVCTWVCNLDGRPHYKTTKGYGVCPSPR